uniref:Reticulon domain-containing protein n=1 Tax=Aegilops tauschii subsp. strangulata TaxID=200361 RepID=A0A453DV17_AEGTS
ETILSERTAKQVILGLHRRLTWFVHRLYAIACGEDIKKFIMTVVSLYIASVVATCFSSLTLLYLGCAVHDDGAGAVRAVRARGGPPGGHGGARRPYPLRQDGLRRAQEDPQGQRCHHRRTRDDGQQRARVASLTRQLNLPSQQHVTAN